MRTALAGVHTGQAVTRGEAGIGATLDTRVGTTAQDGCWDAKSLHCR